MVDILLLSDHPLIRSGIRHVLEQVDAETWQVRAIACTEAAPEIAVRGTTEVVVVDVADSGTDGIDLIRKLARTPPRPKILALIAASKASYARYCLDAGAAGCITNRCDEAEMLRAVRAVIAGERYVGANIARELVIATLMRDDATALDKLSSRESQVMLMIVKGYGVQEISTRLYLSPKTVSTYKSRIYEKLGVKNDVELTHFAVRQGLLGQRDSIA